MASTHPVYQDGEILDATSINSALNPTTADHVPYAVATGSVTFTIPANTDNFVFNIALPAGRFSKTPDSAFVILRQVGAGAASLSQFGPLIALPTSPTQVTCNQIRAQGAASMTGTFAVSYIVVQMAA